MADPAGAELSRVRLSGLAGTRDHVADVVPGAGTVPDPDTTALLARLAAVTPQVRRRRLAAAAMADGRSWPVRTLRSGAVARGWREPGASAARDDAPHLGGPGVRWTVPLRLAAAAAVVLLLGGGAVALRAVAVATSPVPAVSLPTVAGSEQSAGAAPSATPSEVVVHVMGRVARPGVVTLPAGARVDDAVAAAGGVLEDADPGAVNLARVLVDGEQVRVPAVGEVVADPAAGGAAGGAGGAVARVDLNSATAVELDALPGIGPVLAGRIVEWRGEHGRFADVEQLAEVSGIGPSLLERLRDLVRV